jgi:hypothetical protein
MDHINGYTGKAEFFINDRRVAEQTFMELPRDESHQACRYCIDNLKRPKGQISENMMHR